MKFEGYKVNPKHRTQMATSVCTQWIVSEWEELRLFSLAKHNAWFCSKGYIWAVENVEGRLTELGKTDRKSAYIAKYVSNHNNEWHGYPVTPSRNADRPPTPVLDSWRNRSLISKPEQGKIVKGIF